jgi:hypothetical protein
MVSKPYIAEQAWIDIRKETANGTVPNNAMIIALKIEKWAIAGGSRTVSLLGPVAVKPRTLNSTPNPKLNLDPAVAWASDVDMEVSALNPNT